MPFQPPPQLRASMFGRMPVGGNKPKATGGLPAPKAPSGVRVETRIGVQAPAEVIWQVIYDLEGWANWNPMYPKASGIIRIGNKLDVTVVVPGQEPRDLQPTVMEWVPNEQLHWKLTMLGGFITTTRYIEIENLAEASCIVTNGEIFGGAMGASLGRRNGRAILNGFRDMSEALKAEAERRWQARKGAPTSRP